MNAVVLRGYQGRLVEKIRAALRAGKRKVLVVLPTGGGKTVVFAFISTGTAQRGKRILILCHRKELIRQASEKLAAAGIPQHGVIAPGRAATSDLVQVASVQTLQRRLGLPGVLPPDLIVVDEAHHAVAGQWRTILEAFPEALVLGFTATPERGDGKGLGEEAGGTFEDIVEGPPVRELTAEGFLVPAVIYAPPGDGPDLSGVRSRGGDYATDALARAMDKPSITGDAVEHYQRLAHGKAAVAFCVSVRHAETVAEAFRGAGFRAVAVSGASSPEDRDAGIGGLATGAVQVLATCDLISEGLDVPRIEVTILLRPTQSLGLNMQQVGRGLRPIYAKGFDLETTEGRLAAIAASGKPRLIVLDHAGNTLRHGMPDSDRVWSLDGRKKRKGKDRGTPVRQCPDCFAMHPPAPVCPACGHIYETEERELEEREGQLEVLTPERIAHLRHAPLRSLLRPGIADGELETMRKLRGYKAGWKKHVMRELNQGTRWADGAIARALRG